MGKGCAVIHVNSAMPHQKAYGLAVQQGLKVHGVESILTNSKNTPGDWHVCIGPNYALRQWRTSPCLYLDRAYWGDPSCVSVHWLKGGEKHFTSGHIGRDHPELQPLKRGKRTIYLCDYGERAEGDYDTVRLHPAEAFPGETLPEALERHDRAIGGRTTALVDAAIAGLRVKTKSPHSPVYGLTQGLSRKQWIQDLAFHNWSKREIQSGDLFDAIGTDYSAD